MCVRERERERETDTDRDTDREGEGGRRAKGRQEGEKEWGRVGINYTKSECEQVNLPPFLFHQILATFSD